MYINRLTIKNFKCYAFETFDFKSHFTILYGSNGSGKTAILDALAIASSGFLTGIDGALPISIKGEDIRTIWKNHEPAPQVPCEIEVVSTLGHWSRVKETVAGTKTKTVNIEPSLSPIKNIATRLQKERRSSYSVDLPVLAYYGTCRNCKGHEKLKVSTQEEGTKTGYKNSLSTLSSSVEFTSWLTTTYLTFEKTRDPFLGHQIEVAQQAILDILPDDRIVDILPNYRKGEFWFKLDDGTLIPLSKLSDGYKSLIFMAGDIAYRAIQLNPHLGARAAKDSKGLVLIDEIDQHLHPEWQRQVVGSLKRAFPNIQFIASTHSPFIIQSVNRDEYIDLSGQVTGLNPQELTLANTVTDMMHVTSIRSDDFDVQYKHAAEQLADLSKKRKLTPNDLLTISNEYAKILKGRYSDPVNAAYIDIIQKTEDETDIKG